MFPFGVQRLRIRLQCHDGIDCRLNDVTNGTGMPQPATDSDEDAAPEGNSSDRRSLARKAGTSGSGGVGGSGTSGVVTARFLSQQLTAEASEKFPLIDNDDKSTIFTTPATATTPRVLFN